MLTSKATRCFSSFFKYHTQIPVLVPLPKWSQTLPMKRILPFSSLMVGLALLVSSLMAVSYTHLTLPTIYSV